MRSASWHQNKQRDGTYRSDSQCNLGQRVESNHPDCSLGEQRRTSAYKVTADLVAHVCPVHEVSADPDSDINHDSETVGDLADPVRLLGVAHVVDEVGDEAVSGVSLCTLHGVVISRSPSESVRQPSSRGWSHPDIKSPKTVPSLTQPCVGHRSVFAGSRILPGAWGVTIPE